jgi:hypothetical protein
MSCHSIVVVFEHQNVEQEDVERYNVFKSKDRERKRNERSKPKKLSRKEVEEQRRMNRETVKNFRMQQKSTKHLGNTGDEPAYRTPQALGKAIGKVKCHLPNSPRKRKAVVVKLAKDTGIPTPKKKKISYTGNKGLSSNVEGIKAFYFLD